MADEFNDWGDAEDAQQISAPLPDAEPSEVVDPNAYPCIEQPERLPLSELVRLPALPLWVPRSICVLGGVAVGKSSLITSMKQVSDLCGHGRVRLDLKPLQGDFFGALWEPTLEGLGSPHEDSLYEATQAPQEFVFALSGRAPMCWWRRSSPFSTRIVYQDVPGGVVPSLDSDAVSPYRAEVVEQARAAQALVICMDAATTSVEWFKRRMQPLLEECIDERARPSPRLRAGRVLLLFNRVDQAVVSEVHGCRTSRSVTDDLDILALAANRIGVGGLNALYKMIAPNARLAIGISSAFGFNEHGEPLMDDQGRKNRLDDGLDRDGFINRWTPHGVLEALLFLASGQTGGTVIPFEPDALWS